MATTSRRRYRVGEYPEYDNTFDRMAQASVILTGAAGRNIANFTVISMMNTPHGLDRLIEEWRGEKDGDGDYTQNRRPVPSHLKTVQLAIAKLEEDFKTLNQRRVNRGLYPLEQMPSEMLEQLHKLEAQEDVIKDEIKKLEARRSRFTEREEQEKKSNCLAHGPIGSSRLRGGILVELDGQNVAPDSENVLRIKDANSPYNGMRTADYYKHVIPAFRKQQDEEAKAKLEQLQAEARETGRPVPTSLGVTGPHAISKEKLPPWPTGIEKYDWASTK